MLLLFFLLHPAGLLKRKPSNARVLDAGRVNEGYKLQRDDIHYLVIHHVQSEDRARLSSLLKTFNGHEVSFSIAWKTFPALLFRLPQCFGRGLLLFKTPLVIKKIDIIGVEFSQ